MTVDNTVYDTTGDIWWRPEQPLASIRTSLNPARLEYLHDVTARSGLALAGLRVLDVGCGGGLLAEELAQLGCIVSGVDPSAASIATAQRHAAASGLSITYRVGEGEALPYPADSFDLVTCVDVLEHVSDIGVVVAEIARVLRPGGIFLYDTINRTRLSELVMIRLAQQFPATRWMPRDLHAADHFIRPAEMVTALERAGLTGQGLTGMKPRANPRQAGTPAGHQALDDEAGMRVLAVSPRAQGRGVGRALVEPVIARARADGRVGLAIYTRPSMVAAHRLYASLGFERDVAADWQFAPGEWLWGYHLRF